MPGKAKRGHGAGRPFVKGDPRAGRPKGCLNATSVEVRELARKLVTDPAYLTNLKEDLQQRKVLPAVETMLWHYAYGKPRETVAVESNGAPVRFVIEHGDGNRDAQ